ncbi:MAG: DUF2250 domain-containing protein [Desulfotomaculum sp.]|nr:DUF2250 domain-containing protein [Desulfotomaculum sp.]
MSLFEGKYYTDEEIWARAEELVSEYNKTRQMLSDPNISTDPEVMPELAKKLHRLSPFSELVKKLKSCLKDKQELEAMLSEEEREDEENEYAVLYREYSALCSSLARELYNMLLKEGCLEDENEDDKDLEILKFIDYAGPEYAWRLGINVGLDVEESRERLEKLLRKGLLEKVQGTMLVGYHREKDWVKHMNHTYYRISRKGKHYLRRLRRENRPGSR